MLDTIGAEPVVIELVHGVTGGFDDRRHKTSSSFVGPGQAARVATCLSGDSIPSGVLAPALAFAAAIRAWLYRRVRLVLRYGHRGVASRMSLYGIVFGAAVGMLLWARHSRGAESPEDASQGSRRPSGALVLASFAVGLAGLCAYMIWSFRRIVEEEPGHIFALGYALEFVVIPLLIVAAVLAWLSGSRMRRVSGRVLLAAAVIVPTPAACVVPVYVPGPRHAPNVFFVLGVMYYGAAALAVDLAWTRSRWRGLAHAAAALPVAAALLFAMQFDPVLHVLVVAPIVGVPVTIWRAVTGSF